MADDPDPYDEAYLFSGYGGANRPFVAGGKVRGSHWLEGPPDGVRRYVCDWEIAGPLPDLVVGPRLALATLKPNDVDAKMGRARTGVADVDARLVARTFATDLPRHLVQDDAALRALLAPSATLRIATLGRGASRATFEQSVGADTLSVGMENDLPVDPGGRYHRVVEGRVDHVASRTVGGAAAGITAARALVRRLDSLSQVGSWSTASTYRPGVLDDEGLAQLLQAVLLSSSWLSGHADRVGDGVEARLTLPIGDRELRGTLRVRPVDAGTIAATLQAELPDVAGDALVLSPELGLLARLRALREHELGDRALDDALLVEGDALRIDDVRAAAAAILELVVARPRIAVESAQLNVELARAPFDAHLAEVLGAALEVWDRVARRRRGLV